MKKKCIISHGQIDFVPDQNYFVQANAALD